ncbi:hypothetical protein [Herbiconiux sp.]|uniref:hypothetical protein n=1 Tax=Herbiconiux sp. TaxID=1871186 RepID=UPI0025B93474|nr:hypothetical protein [Herbiconiux sp.]
MHSTSPSSRRHRSRLAALGVALGVLALPFVGATTAYAAADTFTVTSPTPGQTDVPEAFPNTAVVDGTGLTDGNHVDVQYVTGDGTLHTAIYADTTGADEWSVIANFDLLGVGETTVVATVSELTPDDTVVVTVPLTFSLAVAPNPADPFTVTSPEVGEVVATATPDFTGTATPGTQIVVLYGARSGSTAEAGTATVEADGTYTVPTDFSRLEPGSLGTGADVYNFDSEGQPIPGIDRLAVFFTFESAPVPLIPLALAVDPASSTVSAATSTGVALTAAGFSPNEELTLSIVDAAGTAIVPVDLPLNIYANDEDGSYAGTVVLPAGTTAGDYTVTLTGVRSERTVSAGFAVVADPVTPVNPVTPGDPGTAGNGDGRLAATGLDGGGFLGLGALLLLAGAAAVIVRRRVSKA